MEGKVRVGVCLGGAGGAERVPEKGWGRRFRVSRQ